MINKKIINLILKAFRYSDIANKSLNRGDYKKAMDFKHYSNYVLDSFTEQQINLALSLKMNLNQL